METPVRVLQVIGIMNRGGAETMIMNLYRNIDKTKVQFDFVVHSNDKGLFDDEIEELGGKIYHCPRYVIKNHLSYKSWWNNFFKEHSSEYIAVHGHIGSTASIYLSIAKRYDLFTIAHSHNTDGKIGIKDFIYKIFTLNTRNIADFFFACSQAAGVDRFGKKIATNEKIYKVLNNAINLDEFCYDENKKISIRNEFKLGDDALIIGHIGRFNEQKNHKFLIDIAKSTINKNKKVVFILVGDGSLKPEIESLVDKYEIRKNVIFTGVRSDVSNFYSGFDLFLFPSFYEGLPVTVIEAQASGLKCLLSDTITKEVDITGLVEYMSLNNSAEKWAEKILSIIPYDRVNTSDKIISAGYDINTTAKQLTDFYLSI